MAAAIAVKSFFPLILIVSSFVSDAVIYRSFLHTPWTSDTLPQLMCHEVCSHKSVIGLGKDRGILPHDAPVGIEKQHVSASIISDPENRAPLLFVLEHQGCPILHFFWHAAPDSRQSASLELFWNGFRKDDCVVGDGRWKVLG